ncbi:COG1470 family protein [Chitinophaga lutea]
MKRNRRHGLVFLLSVFFAGQVYAQTKEPVQPPFSVRLVNLEAASNATFTYNARLQNTAGATRIFQLSAGVPPGWNTSFKVEGMQVTSLQLESGKAQDIVVEFQPAVDVKPGKFNIPVTARAGADTLRLDLEAVVKGSYGVSLTTPGGRLSGEITEGRSKAIQLQVLNTGTLPLENVELSGQAPPKWEVSFSPSSIARLEPGKTADVTATLRVPDKTIAGDYVTNFTVRNSNATATAAFRMTVETSALTGWIGLLVILAAIGAVYFLIRKYGRR